MAEDGETGPVLDIPEENVGSGKGNYFSNMYNKVHDKYVSWKWKRGRAKVAKKWEKEASDNKEAEETSAETVEEDKNLEGIVKTDDTPKVEQERKTVPSWKKYVLYGTAGIVLGLAAAGAWYLSKPIAGGEKGPKADTTQTMPTDTTSKSDSSTYVIPPIQPIDTTGNDSSNMKPIIPPITIDTTDADSGKTVTPITPPVTPVNPGPVTPVNPGPVTQDTVDCGYDNIKLPDMPKIKSLEGKTIIGYQCVKIENSRWKTYSKLYSLTDVHEIGKMCNYLSELNENNNKSELVRKTAGIDNLLVGNDGKVQKGSDGIHGDVAFADEYDVVPIFGDSGSSSTSSTPTGSSSSATGTSTSSTATNSTSTSIDNVVDGNDDVADNGFSKRAYLLMIPIAAGIAGAGKRRDLHPYDAAAEEVSEVYNSNFTSGKNAVKKVMKEYDLTNEEALNVLTGARETENLNYSKALLSTLNKEELAEIVGAYITSENNSSAMDKMMSKTGIKLHSTGSMYKMLDYATQNLGIDKVRKSKLDNFQKDMLDEQLKKYEEQPVEIAYNIAA